MLDREIRTELTPAQALVLIAKTEFRQFTKNDWACFSGCESTNPLVGEIGDYCIVLDGEVVNIIHCGDGYGGQLFNLNEMY
jgi:hypothetical protein